MSSAFGTLFKVMTFGESHGKAVGAVVDGCPAGLSLTETDIQRQLDRRRPGQSQLSTDRNEADRVFLLSGVENGLTLGTPIAMEVGNLDQRPGDYREMEKVPRPSHADFTYQAKYGFRSRSGGGRASARETIGRVAAGAVAEIYLKKAFEVRIVAWVSSVGEVVAPDPDISDLSRQEIDGNAVRCPDANASDKMQALIHEVKADSDSIGGIVSCACINVPPGWGEPVFDKLEAKLAQAMLSIPASKGFEIGSGFGGSRMRGSAHNDPFIEKAGRLCTRTNFSGGIQGGISNGEAILFRVGFKPPATIGMPQQTSGYDGQETVLAAKGRHDPCVVPRAVPIVEGMAALVLADMALRQEARTRAK